MKTFTSPGLQNFPGRSGFLALVLLFLLGLAVNTGSAQTDFASAQPLAGDSGSIVPFDNTGVVADPAGPTIAGLPPTSTIWFQWSSTNSGEVEIDTIGSVDAFFGAPLDTVLGVYTGSALATLSLVSANDNLYPNFQLNQVGQNIYTVGDTNNYRRTTNAPPVPASGIYGAIIQPYSSGPSGLRFNAVAGTTYYFAVDSKNFTGSISLNWSLHPSGVFRFATENSDLTGLTYPDLITPMLLYQVAATESVPVTTTGGDPIRYPAFNNAYGALVTVTRVAGSYGRVTVNYETEDLSTNLTLMGTNGFLINGDLPAVAGTDYTYSTGTLTFDDYEMSKTILIPVSSTFPPRPNRDFGVRLLDDGGFTSPLIAATESSTEVSPPRVDSIFGEALVRILDVNIDPNSGPSFIDVTNVPPGNTNITRLYNTTPTNAVFNFQKQDYRVYRPGTNQTFTIYVNRTGTNTAAATIHYAVNTTFPYLKDNRLNDNNEFPLLSGSDYATPATNNGGVFGTVPDYVFPGGYSGTISWGANNRDPQPITFKIYNNGLQQFNEDFQIDLYNLDSNGNPFQVGMVNNCTVTILNASDLDNSGGTSNINAPAGAVDELFNPDFASDFWLNSDPPDMHHPGTDGVVYGMALQPDGNTVLVGDFFTYNGFGRFCIARATPAGALDDTFDPGQGPSGLLDTFNQPFAHAFISSVLLTTNNQLLIGGDFDAYDGTYRSGIALVNSDGTLDTSFNPGDGFNHTVTALALQPNGQVLVGGHFTMYNGVPRNHIARLNLDGTLDTTFNPGTLLTNTVNAIALQSDGKIVVGGDFKSVGGVAGQDHITRLNADGSLDTAFDVGSGANASVYAIGIQPDGKIVIGGDFNQVNGQNLNGIARISSTNGALDTTFYCGTGVDGPVYNLTIATNTILSTTGSGSVVQTNFTIYVGGAFTFYNGTHRLGFTRLNADGTIDTSFLDTAYNQFAGLTRVNYGDPVASVQASVVQPDGDVLIGGSFEQLGGGQFNSLVRPDSYVGAFTSPITRSAVRNHSNFGRLHGGASAGPGNVGLNYKSYSVNKSADALFVALVRTNGFLGPASANFAVIPGLATNGVDYLYAGDYNGTSPLYWILWEYAGPTRMHSDGFLGQNAVLTDAVIGDVWSGVPYAYVNVGVTGSTNTFNDLTAQFQMSNPVDDQFYLGGEDIPLGIGLGVSASPFKLIEDRHQSGTFGFSAANYNGTAPGASIGLTRTNGNYGVVSVSYATTTNGSTAILNTDYRPVFSGSVSFAASDTGKSFNVQILNSSYIGTVEKTVNLLLTGINPPVNGIVYQGQTNAVLRIINNTYQGYLNLSATNYDSTVNAGSVAVTVTRTVGSLGTLTVRFATTNGTAVSGTDFTGVTNTLTWNNGDVTPRTITIPLINNHQIGASKQFGVRIFNPTNNTVSTPSLFAASAITNALVTINNDNSYGTFQFSSPSYLVNEVGGYSTLTVIRTGSTNGTSSVQFATVDNTAFAGTNYVATNNTLNFVPGQLAASFNVAIKNDGVTNPPPSEFFFTVSLSSPSIGASLGAVSSVSNYIVDAQSYIRPPGDGDTTFTPGTGMNGDVLALALQSSGKIVAGGNFTTVNGVPENHLARLNTNGTPDISGFLLNLAGANGSVYALANQTDDQILVAGGFTAFNGSVRNRITRLNTDGSNDSSFNPGAGADNTVYSIAEAFLNGERKIYIGGAFSTVAGGTHPNLARLNNNGTVDNSFTPGTGPNATVYAVAAYPTNSIFAGKVLVGGAFTNVNNFAAGHIARLNADGSIDTNFDLLLNANDAVRAIAIQSDDRVLIGGDFNRVNGVAFNHIARLNSDGSVDADFTGSVASSNNGTVNAIALQLDGRIVVVGQFPQSGGVTRNNITRLLPNGAADPTINFGDGANGAVDAVVVQSADQLLVFGGGFTQYNGEPAGHIARTYGGSETGSGALKFTSGLYQVEESGVQALIGVRRTGGTSGANPDGSGMVSVTIATSPGDTNPAVAGVNYIPVNQVVSFPPGEVLQFIPVPVLDDSNITANLTVKLNLSNPTVPAILGNQPEAVLTIINVDSSVNFSSADYSVPKNVPTGFGLLDVQRLGTTNGTCSVDYVTTTNGTAVIGTDFYPTNGTITFNPGDTDKFIQVPIVNNSLIEGNRTVVLSLTNNVGTTLSAPSNAVLTIVDTVPGPGALFFSATNFAAGSGDGNAYLTVLRTNGTSGSVSVSFATQQGTALPGIDYNSVNSSVSFNDGDTSKTIAIPLINNPAAQGPVSLTVVLSDPLGGATLLSPTNATVTILNTNVGIAFVLVTNTVSENGGSASLFVSRFGSTDSEVAVSYATTNGTAIDGVNYTAVSGPLIFGSGETLKVISVPLLYDPQVTGDRLFTVGLASADPHVQVVAPKMTTVVVQDADAGLSFTNAAMNVLKNAGVAVITVVCSNPSVEPPVASNTVPLSVNYATADGSALAGIHYTATSGTLVFTNGIGTNTFTVPILINGIIDSNRTFSVNLSNPTPPGQLVAPSSQTVTIVEANNGFSLSQPTYTVLRNGVAANITVLRTGNTNSVASVSFSATNGTAVAGLDYAATNGVFTFTNGVTSQSFAVPVFARTTVQPDATVLLQLFNPTNAILIAPNAATLTIHDTSGSLVVPAGSAFAPGGDPNNNGLIDPGENVTLFFGLRVSGGTNAANVSATLLVTNGVTSPSPASQNYGNLVADGPSASRPFSFTASGTNSQLIAPTFQLKGGASGTNNLGIAVFTYTLGSWTTTFVNTNLIIINDYTMASPYPSLINVSGVGGTLIKATITLTNLSHTSPGDIDALLVAPNQQDTLIMAHAGGTFSLKHITLTFDDAATNSLPNNAQIYTGTNKPTAFLPVPSFP